MRGWKTGYSSSLDFWQCSVYFTFTPETFGPFFFASEKDMKIFNQEHAELMNPAWWNQAMESIITGDLADVFPYPQKRRFKYRYGGW